eukprot:3667642-Pyramimonas_sp.AAC.1
MRPCALVLASTFADGAVGCNWGAACLSPSSLSSSLALWSSSGSKCCSLPRSTWSSLRSPPSGARPSSSSFS